MVLMGAKICTGDLKTTVRCLREARAPTVWFDHPLTGNDAGPYGQPADAAGA